MESLGGDGEFASHVVGCADAWMLGATESRRQSPRASGGAYDLGAYQHQASGLMVLFR